MPYSLLPVTTALWRLPPLKCQLHLRDKATGNDHHNTDVEKVQGGSKSGAARVPENS